MTNTLSHGVISLDLIHGRSWLAWSTVAAVQIVFAIAGLVYGWQWIFVPIATLVCVTTLVWPRAGVFILVTLVYFRYPLPGSENVYPADAMTFLVIAGTFFQRLLHRERMIERTWANRPLMWILIAFAISLTAAFDISSGLKNWLRHAQLIGLMVAVVTCLERRDIFALIRWMLVLTAVFSLGNIVAYISAGGEERVFGPAAAFFATFTVLAALHAAVGFLMARRRSHRLGWALLLMIYGMALMAAQTRAAMIQVMLAIGLLFVVVWFWGKRSRQPSLQWRPILVASALCLLGVVVLADWVPLLHRPAARITEVIEGHAHTVDLRMFLWKTGLQAFVDSPIIGIGLGQVQQWDQFLTFWRFDPYSLMTRGLGAHNDFITYIAETGLLGMAPLMWFLWRMFATGGQALRRVRRHDEAAETMMLWIPAVAIVIGFFFRTHMFYSIAGILTSLYFAFWIKYSSQPSYPHAGAATTITESAA